MVKIKPKEVKEINLPEKKDTIKPISKLSSNSTTTKSKLSTEKIKVTPTQNENVNIVLDSNKRNAETQTEEIFFKM